jgi:hypothetical protein
MAVHGRTVVIAIAALDAKAVREKRVAPGSVDKELCAPGALAIAGSGLDAHLITFRKLDFRDSTAFDRVRTFARGIAKQDFVELGASDFESGRISPVPGLAEVERD